MNYEPDNWHEDSSHHQSPTAASLSLSCWKSGLLSLGLLGFLLAAGSVGAQEQYSQAKNTNFKLFGLGDVTYVTGDSLTEDDFFLSQLVGHAVLNVTDRFNIFAEVAVSGRDSDYEFDVERVIAKYDFSDQFMLSAGKFSTPVGYWNTAFNRGNWLQTSSGRPTNSRLTPSQMIGLKLDGKLPGDRFNISYSAAAGEGHREIIARPGENEDADSKRALGFALYSQPTALKDLNIGLSFYRDRFTPPAASLELDEEVFSAYAAWESETPEVIAEYTRIRQSPVSIQSGSNGVDALNIQFAYRLPGRMSQFKPYLRFEDIDVEIESPMLIGLGNDYEAAFVGMRFDLTPAMALKFEYHRERFSNRSATNNYLIQFSMYIGGGQ